MATTITRLLSTGILQTNVVLDEVTQFTIKNLLIYTDQFNNVVWGKQRSSIGAIDTIAAPNGTFTAEKLIEDTSTTSTHYINSTYASSVGLPTGSIYVKAGERTFCELRIILNGGGGFASNSLVVNLSTGAITTGVGTVTDAGNGWYRISATATTSGTNYAIRLGIFQSSSVFLYTGDGASGLYIWGAQLEDTSSVTLYQGIGTTGTIVTPNYSVRATTSSVYAVQFDEVTQQPIKNLLTYTEEFNNSIWSKAGPPSIIANSIAAPTGTLTADKFNLSTVTNSFYISQDTSVTSGTTYTQSIYAKAGEQTILQITPSSGFTYGTNYVNFDLSSGTIQTQVGNDAVSITSAGNGWYRCRYTQSATTSYSGGRMLFVLTNGNAGRLPTFTGTTGSGIYLWGAQLEPTTQATPYQGISSTGTIITPDFADRKTSTGTYLVSGYFDEFTGAPVVDSSLVLWLDPVQSASYSGTGTVWSDLSTTRNSSTLTNATFNTLVAGGSFNFSGTAYATLASKMSDTGSRTVVIVFRTTTTATRTGLISTRDTLGGWFIALNRSGAGGIDYCHNNVALGATTSTGVISSNTWYIATSRYDTATGFADIYLNTTLVSGPTLMSSVIASTGTSYVAREINSPTTHQGGIGAVMVYNRALASDEIAANFSALRQRYGL